MASPEILIDIMTNDILTMFYTMCAFNVLFSCDNLEVSEIIRIFATK